MPKFVPAPRAVPWLVLLQVANTAREHWNLLEPRERAELQRLLKQSRGRRSNLSAREQSELRRIVRKLELARLGRSVAPIAVRGRRGRRH